MADSHTNVPVPSAGTNTVSGTLTAGIVFPSLSRAAATYNSDELQNANRKGVRLFIDITNVGGAGTLIVKIQVKDPLTKNWADLTAATSVSFTATGTRTLTVYPGITVVAGGANASTEISNFVSEAWRVVATVGTNAVVFSVGADYLL